MLLIAFLGVLAIGTAVPLSQDEITRRAMYNPDLFEGDITGIVKDMDRNAIVDPAEQWPEGVVPYVIDSSLSTHKDLILEAMETYHKKTCIRFVPRKKEDNYIVLKLIGGCSSAVGVQGGEQIVTLGEGCHHRQIIEHELGHAIGFWHEQSRSDRDDYLTIYWDNIYESVRFNFDKLNPWMNNLLGEEFDYDSIMLYDNYAFAKNPDEKSMEAKNGQLLLPAWEKPGLSASDIRRVNKLYECNGEKRPDPLDPPDWICDFEEGICGMDNPQDKWTWGERTIGEKTSHVVAIENKESTSAALFTPWLYVGRPRTNGCIYLDAYLDGKDAHAISVYVYDGNNPQTLVLELKTKSDKWQHFKLKVDDIGKSVLVAFYGMTSGADRTLAIDNIRLSINPCEK